MKTRRIIYLEKLLRFMAIATLKRQQPKIIGITGSVGKSSAKEAVFLVLKNDFKVRKNEDNYNNEIGIPLTIIGSRTGGRNIFKWGWVFIKWIFRLIFSWGYPEILILEMAVDKPGDMKYLVNFIPVNVGILTNISASHFEFFKDIGAIVREKMFLIKSVQSGGAVILNIDNVYIRNESKNIKNKIISYGSNQEADVKMTDVRFNYDKTGVLPWLSYKINYSGKSVPLRLPHIIGKHQLYATLAAVAVSEFFKVNLINALKALEGFKAPCGRMNLITLKKGGLLIDDTYNSSLESTLAAIDTVREINAKRKFIVLGDMLELGEKSKESHLEVVKTVLENKFDKLILVGRRMCQAGEDFLGSNSYMKSILFFSSPDQVAVNLQKTIKFGDLILIKGSQGMRMEKISEALMADSAEAKRILCRQSKSWKEKEFIQN
jgi:UDP-N-acetylmuramoyl-tripeptide--D-alanyl-D-alanine ligase